MARPSFDSGRRSANSGRAATCGGRPRRFTTCEGTMTSQTNDRYIGTQVRSRARVILTRRDDLRVVETKDQTDLDLHVYVDREDKSMRLVFGVLLRGVPSPTTA